MSKMINEGLVACDREMVEFFTSSVGVRAQCYDAETASASYVDGDDRPLGGTSPIERYDAIANTLRAVSIENRRVLELVYVPCSAGSLKLASDLSPPWGGGSFVRLAALVDESEEAYRKRYPNTVDVAPAAVLQFLRDESGRGQASTSLLRKVGDACSRLRERALRDYDHHRTVRVESERKAREVKARQREATYERLVGAKRTRDAEAFEARLRAVTS